MTRYRGLRPSRRYHQEVFPLCEEGMTRYRGLRLCHLGVSLNDSL